MPKKKKNSDWRNQPRERDGSIRVNKDGSFTGRIQYIDDGGKKKEKTTKRFTKRSECWKEIKVMRSQLEDHGTKALDANRLTFATLANRYEETKLIHAEYRDGKRIAGLRSIKPVQSAIKPLKEYFGRRVVREIRSSDLFAYQKRRLNTPVVKEINVKQENPVAGRKKFVVIKQKVETDRTLATVNRELQLLRSIFNFAKSDKLIASSPFDNQSIISASRENIRDRVLDDNEEIRLLAACADDRAHLRPIVIAALDTAMRRGELLKLVWADIDFDNEMIRVEAANTKTERPRLAPMTCRLRDELVKLWESSPKEQGELVFGITNTFKKAWKSACTKAGIDGLRFHDLRHTATTRLIRSKVPLSEAMKITGHSQLKTFQRYMNLTNENVTACGKQLDVYLKTRHQGDQIATG